MGGEEIEALIDERRQGVPPIDAVDHVGVVKMRRERGAVHFLDELKVTMR
ncbi:MAG: hypothetical protein SOI64_08820 [Bifidobacterium mongoliense]